MSDQNMQEPPEGFGADKLSERLKTQMAGHSFDQPTLFCGKTAEQWHNSWLLEYNGRKEDMHNRGLPLAWKRKCNGKLYGLDGVHVMFGKVMVWVREDGTNKGLHIPLSTLAARFRPVDIVASSRVLPSSDAKATQETTADAGGKISEPPKADSVGAPVAGALPPNNRI